MMMSSIMASAPVLPTMILDVGLMAILVCAHCSLL